MAKNDASRRSRYIRDAQLHGLTYAEAAERWRVSEEIADTFLHDGVRTEADLSEAEIRDAIEDYQAIRMSNLENDLLAAGFTPVPLDIEGVIVFTGWIAPGTMAAEYSGYCTVCGCNAGDCGGPTDPMDMDPDTDLCRCYDDELGEPVC